MLEDPDFIGAVKRLIQENQLSAERAFEFETLELRLLWAQSDSAMLRQRRTDLAGVAIRVLQRLLGHSDPKLTMAIYTHLGIEDLRGAVESLPPLRVARG